MCGGQGTRLDAQTEKPLFEVGGRPMVDRVHDALAGSRLDAVHAVTSPATPQTREHLGAAGVATIEAPGDGYVADLAHAAERVDTPVLTVVADLPLLSSETVDSVLVAHDEGSLTVCVPVDLKRRLGVSADTTLPDTEPPLAPTGLNVLADPDAPDDTMTRHDPRLAVNVNRRRDAAVAEALL
jgi:adenosylcobinamide-phosphate guanylyltransferase